MHERMKAFFRYFILMVLIPSFIVTLLMFFLFGNDTYAKRLEAKRLFCKEQLKGIYELIQSYKAEFRVYPDKFVNLPTYKRDVKLFLCPNSEMDYEYQPENNIAFHDRNPILWDKKDFHLNYGNVLFKDGTIQALERKEWDDFLKSTAKQK